MKVFLIATDFSAASRDATQYGIALARAFDGRVVLVNAYEQAPVTITEPLVFAAPDMGALATQQLEGEADFLSAESPTPVEIVAKEGSNADAILEVAKEMNADLIIAGMKGNGKSTRRFFGSTITSLAKKTTIPLLVIPEKASYKSPKAIAFANDISPQTDARLLDTLSALIGKFHSKLYIVRVITKKSDEVVEVLSRPSNFSEMVEKLEPLYEYPVDNNITKALDHFMSTHRVDMLVMIPHKESIPERWFFRSNTRQMLFKTNIPLLILPEAGHGRGKHRHSVVF